MSHNIQQIVNLVFYSIHTKLYIIYANISILPKRPAKKRKESDTPLHSKPYTSYRPSLADYATRAGADRLTT